MKKFQYNITHRDTGKKERINFKSKGTMLTYLDKNRDKLNNMKGVVVNFATIALPLKVTSWNLSGG